jgi:hypothetical protein
MRRFRKRYWLQFGLIALTPFLIAASCGLAQEIADQITGRIADKPIKTPTVRSIVNLAELPSPQPTATDTATPTSTLTPIPTSTSTQTPIPTLAPTVTDAPTLTPPAQLSPISSATSTDQPITGLMARSSSPTLLEQPTFFTVTISSGTNVSYAWDFGDELGFGSGSAPIYYYRAPGIYTGTVTATNQAGLLTATVVTTVTAPVAIAQVPTPTPIIPGDDAHSGDGEEEREKPPGNPEFPTVRAAFGQPSIPSVFEDTKSVTIPLTVTTFITNKEVLAENSVIPISYIASQEGSQIFPDVIEITQAEIDAIILKAGKLTPFSVSRMITVPIASRFDDPIANEPPERVSFALISTSHNHVLTIPDFSKRIAMIEIKDNDETEVGFNADWYEIQEEASPALLSVELSNVSAIPVTVTYRTLGQPRPDRNAFPPDDIKPIEKGILVIPPRRNNANIGVIVLDDEYCEIVSPSEGEFGQSYEWINLELITTTNAMITGSTVATLTLNDFHDCSHQP